MIVEWSDLALDDLEDIKNYISKDSPYYARELVESVFIAAERLIDFPFSGRQKYPKQKTVKFEKSSCSLTALCTEWNRTEY